MDTTEYIYKLSVDIDNLAYKISLLEEEIAKLHAHVEDIKERE